MHIADGILNIVATFTIFSGDRCSICTRSEDEIEREQAGRVHCVQVFVVNTQPIRVAHQQVENGIQAKGVSINNKTFNVYFLTIIKTISGPIISPSPTPPTVNMNPIIKEEEEIKAKQIDTTVRQMGCDPRVSSSMNRKKICLPIDKNYKK